MFVTEDTSILKGQNPFEEFNFSNLMALNNLDPILDKARIVTYMPEALREPEICSLYQVDGITFINDSRYDSAPFLKLNSDPETRATILTIDARVIARQLAPRLASAIENDTTIIVPGNGGARFYQLLQEYAPLLPNKVVRVSPFRTLSESGEPSVRLSPLDFNILRDLPIGPTVIVDDVISSGETLKAICNALWFEPDVSIFSGFWAIRYRENDVLNLNRLFDSVREVVIGAAVQRTDRVIPPINTLSTFFSDPVKYDLSVRTLGKYISGVSLQRARLEAILSGLTIEGELDPEAVLQELASSLKGKKLFLTDLDDTLTDGSLNYDYNKFRDALNALDPGDYVIIPNSDSPASLLKEMFQNVPVIIAERGAEITIGKSLVLRFTDLDEKKSAVVDYLQVQGIKCLELGNATQIAAGVDRLESGDASSVVGLINGERRGSIGIYIGRISISGYFSPISEEELRAIKGQIELLIGEDSLDINAYPNLGSILIRDTEVGKTTSTQFLLDLVTVFNGQPKEIYMFGNSSEDFIDDPRVISVAVSNADEKLKSRARIVSSFTGIETIKEFI